MYIKNSLSVRNLLRQLMRFSSLQHAASTMELHSPDQVAYVNVNNNTTTGTSEYQDLHQRPQENTGQYQELVTKQETSVKLVNNKPDITYENTKMEGQKESEQSQYEELNTRNERKDEHAYSEVSLK